MTTQEVTTTSIRKEVGENSHLILSALHSYFWSGEDLPKGKDRWPLGISSLYLMSELL